VSAALNPVAPEPDVAMRDAILIVAEVVGDLMGFWNFKPSMGRLWAVLYLSQQPLSAEELVEASGLSAGSVSMTLQELQRWGVVRRAPGPHTRSRLFEAETDILSLVTRVFRERELMQIDDAVRRLEQAVAMLAAAASSRPDQMMKSRFLLTRAGNVLELARKGRAVIDGFARAGSLDLSAIRGALRRG
jgi:HTH-type transcriptional regulator, glycine betaine synthesis regulator